MAAMSLTMTLLECDGCGVVFGAPYGFVSPGDARGAAYGAGWRFPAHLTKNGSCNTSSDVCPKCIDGWTPQARTAKRRILSRAEIIELHKPPPGTSEVTDGR